MKKNLYTLLLAMLVVLQAHTAGISESEARLAARNFLQSAALDLSDHPLELAAAFHYFLPDAGKDGKLVSQPVLYIFNATAADGFVIISADDIAYPVLGYSFNGHYQQEELPPALRKMLEGYKNQIAWAIENNGTSTTATQSAWEHLLQNGQYNAVRASVGPLMSTTWDQSPYYNDLCPGGSVTGCVATAMAQVMKFWNHPAQGTGMHSYNHPDYGTISANFGATTYNWSAMPNNVNSPNNSVATLMFHCGVGVNMQYSPNSSGAYVVELDHPISAESAMKNFFGYSPALQGVKRDGNYTTAQWVSLIKAELDASRPVLYAGFGSGGGHAFVCDGYDNSNKFHFNWGWGGYYDGYFAIDALDPGGTGTGGGTGGYNSGHQALIGVVPATGPGPNTHDLALYANLSITPETINMGQAFSVHTDIANYGDGAFDGDFAAVVFNSDYNLIDVVEIKEGYNLPPQSHYTNGLTFSTDGLNTLLPGTYYISILYKPNNGEWDFVRDGNFYNLALFNVINSNVIELYSDMQISTGNTVMQNESFSINVDVANYGSTTFQGTIDISFYYMDGSHAQSVEMKSNVSMDGGYYYNMTFSTNGINLEPGTYYLAMQHRWQSGDWELTGSSYYPNPIQVVLQQQGLQADNFEPNNSPAQAALLPINWSNNDAVVNTEGSNLHHESDYDYYKMDLPAGYDYTVSCRAHDSYNSGNNQVYTVDVMWSYHTGDEWIGPFDDVMAGNIHVSNGGVVYFYVAPYFQGSTGTYLLEMHINRSVSSADEQMVASGLSVYPNPASKRVFIKSDGVQPIESIKLYNAQAALVRQLELPQSNQSLHEMDIKSLPAGNYVLQIRQGGILQHKKLIIAD